MDVKGDIVDVNDKLKRISEREEESERASAPQNPLFNPDSIPSAPPSGPSEIVDTEEPPPQ
eukprot:957092-Prorocentrum_minimum.AAC.2